MVPAVLIQKSTKEIIKHSDYPRADMQPVQDMDPDFEWLINHIPFSEPPYDPRVYIMQTNLPDLQFLSEFQEHPLYPGLREYRITYTPTKRPDEEIIMAIENAEKEANAAIWSESVHKDETLFMINSVRKEAQNISLTAEEQTHIEKLSSINVKLAKNLDNKEILTLQVNNGQTPNIDEGWEKSV
jgi:hypothetical protein